MRSLNLDSEEIDERDNKEPRRRSRIKDKLSSEINIHDQQEISLKSLEVSQDTYIGKDAEDLSTICKKEPLPEINDKSLLIDDQEYSYECSDYSISISPPQVNHTKDRDYDRSSKKSNNNQSPDEDFSINEQELDENFNSNIYSDDGFEDLERQYQTDQQQDDLKHYYLKQSQFLSGITERTIEESVFAVSQDNVNQKFNDSRMKHLLVSKYSCPDKIGLGSQKSDDDQNECSLSMSSFDLVAEKQYAQEEQIQTNEMEKSLKDVKFSIPIDSIRTENKSHSSSSDVDHKYRTFRQGGKGILTLDELIQNDNSSTPSKNHKRMYEIEKNPNHSQISFSTLSNQKSDNRSAMGGYNNPDCHSKRAEKTSDVVNNEFFDFSSIKKFEESESTLRKDNSVPELYTSLPIRNTIEMSPEANSKNKRSSKMHNINSKY